MARNFKPDHKGLEEVLLSARVAALVQAEADGIAQDLRAAYPDAPIVVDAYEYRPRRFPRGRRAARSVTFARADGEALQARDGIMTRAAAARGLEVTER
jgi:hypothetical protein